MKRVAGVLRRIRHHFNQFDAFDGVLRIRPETERPPRFERSAIRLDWERGLEQFQQGGLDGVVNLFA
jgi:hypothetical protein